MCWRCKYAIQIPVSFVFENGVIRDTGRSFPKRNSKPAGLERVRLRSVENPWMYAAATTSLYFTALKETILLCGCSIGDTEFFMHRRYASDIAHQTEAGARTASIIILPEIICGLLTRIFHISP